MGRLFDATTEVLKTAAGLTVPTEGSLAFWLYPTTLYNDNADHVYFDVRNASPLRLFHMEKYTDNKVYIGWYNNTNDDRVVVSAGNLIRNQWNLIVLTWAQAGKSYFLINNSLQNAGGTNLDATWDTSACILRIGNPPAENINAACYIAEFAIWNIGILAADLTNMYNNHLSPLFVHPESLIHYWPLIGAGSAEPDMKSPQGLAVTGATQVAHLMMRYRRDTLIHPFNPPSLGSRLFGQSVLVGGHPLIGPSALVG